MPFPQVSKYYKIIALFMKINSLLLNFPPDQCEAKATLIFHCIRPLFLLNYEAIGIHLQ